jgi:hypothetical protein
LPPGPLHCAMRLNLGVRCHTKQMRSPIYKAEIMLLPAANRPRLVPGWRPGLAPFADTTPATPEPGLGIVFASGPGQIEIGSPATCAFQIMAWPDPACDRIAVGVEFALLEGSTMVGTGKVIAMEPASGT